MVAARRLSLVVVCGLLIAVASLVVEDRVQSRWLWGTGSVAPWYVGSSQTRDRTHVCCILTTGPPGESPRVFINEEHQAVQGHVQKAWETEMCLDEQVLSEAHSRSRAERETRGGTC